VQTRGEDLFFLIEEEELIYLGDIYYLVPPKQIIEGP